MLIDCPRIKWLVSRPCNLYGNVNRLSANQMTCFASLQPLRNAVDTLLPNESRNVMLIDCPSNDLFRVLATFTEMPKMVCIIPDIADPYRPDLPYGILQVLIILLRAPERPAGVQECMVESSSIIASETVVVRFINADLLHVGPKRPDFEGAKVAPATERSWGLEGLNLSGS